MCGRFALNATEADLKSHFHLSQGFVARPRFNISPGTPIPIIKTLKAGVDFAQWGFMPSWYKTLPPTQKQGYMNARMETLTEKPAFKSDFQKHRCLIPATGYFEWRKFNEKKQPYYVYLKNTPLFAFAGIWSSWDTCAILTMEAPPFLQALHERVPVIVSPAHYAAWLKPGLRANLQESVLTLQEEMVGVHAVSPRMNRPQFDEPMCIQPF